MNQCIDEIIDFKLNFENKIVLQIYNITDACKYSRMKDNQLEVLNYIKQFRFGSEDDYDGGMKAAIQDEGRQN